MILSENKKTDYQIVIAKNAGEPVRYAADQLAAYLAKITGADFPIVTDDHPALDTEIVIGPSNRPGAPCAKELKNDGYRITSYEGRLFILGDGPRGCLYGVYGLLEEKLGCRFLSKDVEKIPCRSRLVLEDTDITRIPPLEYRETFWYEPETYPEFALKRGFNGSIFNNYPARAGGGIQYWGFAHTLFNYVSPDDYFDTHPEYFSMIDGVRIRERTQLCLTNPEVLAITRKKLRQNIIDHPECKIFSLTQMDWYNPCTCPECARVDAEEGSHSGTMLRFVNACAESIAEDFPDVIIDTFAYQFTRKPPAITRPAPNVCVRICSIECCFSHPLRSCDEVAHPYKERALTSSTSFQQDLAAWSKICKRVFVWDYITNYKFYLAPFPNFRVLKDNINFFLENGVTGLFEQGNAQSVSGEFGELRAYLISRIMWNPDTDVDMDMDEFLAGYYGMAAAPIGAYIQLLTEHVSQADVHMGIYYDPRWYITDELLEKAQALWDEAESLAADADELFRIQKSRLQLRYAQLQRMPLDNPLRAGLIDTLEADVARFGLSHIRESRAPEVSFAQLRTGGPYL